MTGGQTAREAIRISPFPEVSSVVNQLSLHLVTCQVFNISSKKMTWARNALWCVPGRSIRVDAHTRHLPHLIVKLERGAISYARSGLAGGAPCLVRSTRERQISSLTLYYIVYYIFISISTCLSPYLCVVLTLRFDYIYIVTLNV